MNLYEHTIIARQDASPSELKQLTEKYSKIVEKNEGEVVKTENWGLLNLSYVINKNRKGSYIHFKIKGKGKVVEELEKNEAIDKKARMFWAVVKPVLARPWLLASRWWLGSQPPLPITKVPESHEAWFSPPPVSWQRRSARPSSHSQVR